MTLKYSHPNLNVKDTTQQVEEGQFFHIFL